MRIACLQFAPQVGDVDNNLNRADAVLSRANPQDLDLLVLPELAFSGYNFRSLQHISPFLEPTASGISSLWARTTALKYNCTVTVGYPEKVDATPKWPGSLEYYNSAITVNADGETIANYRKSFLYYTDETWALEGPDGFYDGEIVGLGNVAMGICKWPTKSFERMDLNPCKFEAPWSAWEFAYHILHKQANLVILLMAWLTREDPRSYSRLPKKPDMEALSYWMARLEPLIRAETVGEIIVVLANRTGTEDEAVYAGTSTVLGIEDGEVRVYGILGRGEKELLLVDTNKRPKAKLVSEPSSTTSDSVPQNSELGTSTASRTKRPRTNSTVSSLPSLPSLDTQTTACTSPESDRPTTNTGSLLSGYGNVSPCGAYAVPRARKAPGETLRESLEDIFDPEDSSRKARDMINRPVSPKSRNNSQTRSDRLDIPGRRPSFSSSKRSPSSSGSTSSKKSSPVRKNSVGSASSPQTTKSSPDTLVPSPKSRITSPGTQTSSPKTVTGSPKSLRTSPETTSKPSFESTPPRKHTRAASHDLHGLQTNLTKRLIPSRATSRSASPTRQAAKLAATLQLPSKAFIPRKQRSASMVQPDPSLFTNDLVSDETVVLAPAGLKTRELPLWPAANPLKANSIPTTLDLKDPKALPGSPRPQSV